jgi:undecaprenyl-diphosphatase
VNTVIVAVAQYLLWVLAAGAVALWLTRDRSGKVRLGLEAVAGLAVVGGGIWLAAHLHSDPRPFVSDPSSAPLFPHPADNGFPSDHSAAAALVAVLIARYKPLLGALAGVAAVAIAWARVAAHVHHLQDVVAGLAIGAVAGVVGVWIGSLLWVAAGRRWTLTGARSGGRR